MAESPGLFVICFGGLGRSGLGGACLFLSGFSVGVCDFLVPFG